LVSLTNARPASAQTNAAPSASDGSWLVTDGLDKAPNSSGDGYVLAGPLTGTATQSYPAGMPAWPYGMAPFYQPQQYPGDNNTPSAPQWNYTFPGFAAYATAGNDAPAPFGGSPSSEFYAFDYDYVLFGSAGLWHDTTGTVTDALTGPVSATWTWAGTGSPPDHLDLLVTTRLSAWASVSATGASGTALASDALGDAISADANTPTPPDVLKRHLLRVPVVNGVAVYNLSGSASALAGVSLPVGQMQTGGMGYDYYQQTNGGLGATAYAQLSAAAQRDTREVTISSYIDPSHYKGVYDIAHGTDGYLHVQQPNRNVADSVVNFINDPVTGPQFVASGNYTANALNFTTPSFTWAVSGDGAAQAISPATFFPDLDYPYGLATVPILINFGPTWDTAKTKTNQFSVSVIDTDQAIGYDTYKVTWHAPQENFVPIGSVRHNVPQLYGTLQSIGGNTTQVQIF
jgi:hypothetical protein